MADIIASALRALRAKAGEVFKNSPLQLANQIDVTAAKAVLENQTVQFKGFDDYMKDNKLEVIWINDCVLEAQDCTDNCDFDGEELSTEKKEYEPNICKEVTFKVNEDDFRTNDFTFSDFLTTSFAKAISTLDEFWATKVLAKLKTFAGVNIDSNSFITYNAGEKNSTFEVPLDPAQYGSVYNRILLLQQNFMKNRMGNPYVINNGNLWLPFQNANLRSQDPGGQGNLNILKNLNIYFDMLNFGKAGLDEHTFAVSTGAVGFATVNKFPKNPRPIGGKVGQTRYRVKSLNLPGVEYDAIYTVKCENNNIYHYWKLITHGLIEQSPFYCPIDYKDAGGSPQTTQLTGVLAYK